MQTLSEEFEPAINTKAARLPSVPGRVAFCLLASITCILSDSLRVLLPLAAAATLYGSAFTPRRRMLRIWVGLALFGCITLASITLLPLALPGMSEWTKDYNVATPVLRIWIVVHTVMALTVAVNLTELFRTVTVLPLPYVIKLPFLLIIRFLPSFVNESRLLTEAVKLRFAGRGTWGWCIRPVQAWRVLFMPVVVRIIRTSDELAMATELKGVSPQAFPTSRRRLFHGIDCFLLGSWLLLTIITMTYNWMAHAAS